MTATTRTIHGFNVHSVTTNPATLTAPCTVASPEAITSLAPNWPACNASCSRS